MKKRFLTTTLIFLVVIVLIGFVHISSFSFTTIYKVFLVKSYIYMLSSSLFICLSLGFLMKKQKFQHRIGLFYLFSVPLKIIFFVIIFQKQFFDQTSDSSQELINCLFILVLTLFFEVFFMSRILNSSNAIKNVE